MFTASTEQQLRWALRQARSSEVFNRLDTGLGGRTWVRRLLECKELGTRKRQPSEEEVNRGARFHALEIVAGSMFATDKRILFTSHSLAHLSERIATNKASLQQPI